MSNSAQTSASNHITALLDENSFVEVGAYITARSTDFNMTEQETPADDAVTGYGTISGCLVYVYGQDVSVLDGSTGEMHTKKICNIYSMAMKIGAPVIGLVDCAELCLQEVTDALDGSGRLYLSQTTASGAIPQIAAIFGACGGGMAVSTGITDFTFMERKSGKLFVNAPNVIDGNYIEKCDTSSADFQAKESGLVDFADDEASIMAQIRSLVSILPSSNEDDMPYGGCQDDLNRICGNLEACIGGTDLALTMISDNNFFMEVKKAYEPSMVTGSIRLSGTTVGCAANRTEVYDNGEKKEEFEAVLSGRGCDKVTDSINFCDAFNIPVLTLVSVKGYKAKICSERRVAKAVARLIYAYANASVPKVTVVVKDALSSAYLSMGSRSIRANVVYAWPGAVIGTMGPSEAVKITYAKEIAASDQAIALIAEKITECTSLQSSAVSAAKRGHVDDIVKAEETRQRVIAAFGMLFTKREDRSPKKRGTV